MPYLVRTTGARVVLRDGRGAADPMLEVSGLADVLFQHRPLDSRELVICEAHAEQQAQLVAAPVVSDGAAEEPEKPIQITKYRRRR